MLAEWLATALMQRKAALAAIEWASVLYAQLDGLDVPVALAEIQRLTGWAYTFLGRISEADAFLNGALATFRARGDGKLAGMTLAALVCFAFRRWRRRRRATALRRGAGG